MPHDHETILVLQADNDNREMYAAYLQQAGYRPVLARTAREALRVADKVDAIITGILVPGEMDGVELLQRLKDNERTARIPVIVVTSCCWMSERMRAERAGTALFFGKPCLPEQLVDGLRQVLAARDTTAERQQAT